MSATEGGESSGIRTCKDTWYPNIKVLIPKLPSLTLPLCVRACLPVCLSVSRRKPRFFHSSKLTRTLDKSSGCCVASATFTHLKHFQSLIVSLHRDSWTCCSRTKGGNPSELEVKTHYISFSNSLVHVLQTRLKVTFGHGGRRWWMDSTRQVCDLFFFISLITWSFVWIWVKYSMRIFNVKIISTSHSTSIVVREEHFSQFIVLKVLFLKLPVPMASRFATPCSM